MLNKWIKSWTNIFSQDKRAWQWLLMGIKLFLSVLLTTKLYSENIFLVAWLVKTDILL